MLPLKIVKQQPVDLIQALSVFRPRRSGYRAVAFNRLSVT
jgi:hypothetical protein